MTNLTFVQLPNATVISGTEVVPVQQGGLTAQTTVAQFIAAVLGGANVLPGTFSYAGLPSAVTNVGKYAVTTDQGAVFALGGIWQILYNATTGTVAIANNSPLTPATLGSPYSLQLNSTAGIPPYVYSLLSTFGAANVWAINATGLLTGTPNTVSGVSSNLADILMVQVSDATGAVTQKLLTLKTVASVTPAATPTFSPLAGTYIGTQTVTISCSTGSSTIYYTTNGSTPSTGSPIYTTPISVTSSQTVKAIATAPGFTQSAVGSASYVINTALLGTQMVDIDYFNPEQPFLNIMKCANGNDNYWQTAWGTCTILGGGGTHEQGYLQLDSDGYVKSLTASPIPSGGQVFTLVQVLINFNINNPSSTAGLPPDAPFTYGYANIVYRLQFTGKGTIQLAGDPTSGSGTGTNGLTFTSAINGVSTFTFTVASPATGIKMGITALPDSVNYIRNISVVDNTLASSFDGGEIFHPRFLASVTNFSPLRFMTWLSIDNHQWTLKFPSAITASDTSAKIGSPNGSGTFSNGSTSVTGVSGWQTQSAAGDLQEIIAPGFVTAGTTVVSVTGSSPNITLTLSAPAIGTSAAGQTFGYTMTWTGKTATYNMLIGSFNQGAVNTTTSQMLSVNLTFGSKTCAFNTPISNSYPQTHNQTPGTAGFVPLYPDWASRPQSTSCFWNSTNSTNSSGSGVPYEVCIALCNKLNVDGWFNIPIWANTFAGSQAFWSSLATLIQSTLNSNLKCYVELSNEVWNGLYPQQTYAIIAGINSFFPAQNTFSSGSEWYGTQVAQIADAFRTVFGSGPMASRVIVGMGEQFALGNGDSFLRAAMNAPEWVAAGNTAPYLHLGSSGAVYVAPYFGMSNISTADANTCLATADPLTTFFQLAWTNVPAGGGGTYASQPATGFIGGVIATAVSLKAANAGQPWGNLPHYGYEAGSNFFTGGKPVAWQNLIVTAHRDTRFQYLYYDRLHVISSNNGYLPLMASSAGYTLLCQFANCSSINTIGEYGALENINQPLTPLSSAPPKWQGLQKYIQGL